MKKNILEMVPVIAGTISSENEDGFGGD